MDEHDREARLTTLLPAYLDVAPVCPAQGLLLPAAAPAQAASR